MVYLFLIDDKLIFVFVSVLNGGVIGLLAHDALIVAIDGVVRCTGNI